MNHKLLGLFLCALSVNAETQFRTSLYQGEQRALKISGLFKYAVDSNQSLKVLWRPGTSKEEILLRAEKPGVARLTYWNQKGEVGYRTFDVFAPSNTGCTHPPQVLTELNEIEIIPILSEVSALPRKNGPRKDRESGDKSESSSREKCVFLLRGEYHSLREAQLIAQLLKIQPSLIQNQTQPSVELFESQSKLTQNWIQENKIPLKTEINSGTRTLLIFGTAPNPVAKKIWLSAIETKAPFAKGFISTLPDDSPILHVKVYLLEVNRNYLKKIGFQPPSMTSTLVRGLQKLTVQNQTPLEGILNALESQGQGRVLSQPELTVRAPGQAEVFSGGEFPIEIKSAYNNFVQWKKFGLGMKLNISNVTFTHMRATLETEVSSLTPPVAGDIPALQANRLYTEIDAELERPLLLSGLIQESTRKSSKGLPWLSQIPIFGLLFSSKDYLEDRTDFVAVLHPSKRLNSEILEKLQSPKLLVSMEPSF